MTNLKVQSKGSYNQRKVLAKRKFQPKGSYSQREFPAKHEVPAKQEGTAKGKFQPKGRASQREVPAKQEVPAKRKVQPNYGRASILNDIDHVFLPLVGRMDRM